MGNSRHFSAPKHGLEDALALEVNGCRGMVTNPDN
jgi:hypothetical protein